MNNSNGLEIRARVAPALLQRMSLLLGTCLWLQSAALAAPQVAPSIATPEPVAKPESPAPQPAPKEFWLRVTGNSVNLRSRPDVNSTPLAQLDRDTFLEGAGMESGWYRVRPPRGVFSLVDGEFIQLKSDDEGEVAIRDGTLRVRAGSLVTDVNPTTAEVQTLLERGARVVVVGRNERWLKIAPPEGVFAYVSVDYVERVDEDQVVRAANGQPQVRYVADAAAALPGDVATVASGESPSTLPPALPPGPWATRLSAAEALLDAEAGKPESERKWSVALRELSQIAAQKDEPQAATLAAHYVVEIQRAEPAPPPASAAAPAPASRPKPSARPTAPRPPVEIRGRLMPGFELELGEFGLRYRLEDLVTRRALGYAEFSPELKLDLTAALGKYVGVSGERQFDLRNEIPVIRATSLTVLSIHPNPAAPAPARRGP
jgi:hypothetical protein